MSRWLLTPRRRSQDHQRASPTASRRVARRLVSHGSRCSRSGGSSPRAFLSASTLRRRDGRESRLRGRRRGDDSRARRRRRKRRRRRDGRDAKAEKSQDTGLLPSKRPSTRRGAAALVTGQRTAPTSHNDVDVVVKATAHAGFSSPSGVCARAPADESISRIASRGVAARNCDGGICAKSPYSPPRSNNEGG